MTGTRIGSLAGLTREQDLAVVVNYMNVDPFVQSLAHENRSDWYETHLAQAMKYGTTVSEQLLITAQIADGIDDTQWAVSLLRQFEEFVDGLPREVKTSWACA